MLPLLLLSGSVHVTLQPILSIFALKTADGKSGGMCLVPHLDAMGKLLLPLVGPFVLLLSTSLWILIVWIKTKTAVSEIPITSATGMDWPFP